MAMDITSYGLSKREQQKLLKRERLKRTLGDWGPWQLKEFPEGTVGHGWASEFTRAHKNNVFSVLDRTLPNGIRHLAITCLSEVRPSWPEMQRIKDELAGPTATAVEVYPPEAEIVDDANMYHLWVTTTPLPFSLFDNRR
ncbi:DUF7694 domain-containing protein [Pseudovibrio ascidiaceicola]|uniref:DUF7694 domain-containing protein n=1 Tax=Pseudovibrio ascidiaceicola TaxID=285279 RepID=UPI003D35F6C1